MPYPWRRTGHPKGGRAKVLCPPPAAISFLWGQRRPHSTGIRLRTPDGLKMEVWAQSPPGLAGPAPAPAPAPPLPSAGVAVPLMPGQGRRGGVPAAAAGR